MVYMGYKNFSSQDYVGQQTKQIEKLEIEEGSLLLELEIAESKEELVSHSKIKY